MRISQAKREIAKKEGRLLTKKQKEEKAAAEIRKQALLASGVQVQGLQQSSDAPPAAKKFSYGKKKKGPAQAVGTLTKDSTPVGTPSARSSSLPPEPVPEVQPETKDEEPTTPVGVKDEWDASSDDEAKAPTPTAPVEVKDSWDESTDEEAQKPAKPAEPVPKGMGFLR